MHWLTDWKINSETVSVHVRRQNNYKNFLFSVKIFENLQNIPFIFFFCFAFYSYQIMKAEKAGLTFESEVSWNLIWKVIEIVRWSLKMKRCSVTLKTVCTTFQATYKHWLCFVSRILNKVSGTVNVQSTFKMDINIKFLVTMDGKYC